VGRVYLGYQSAGLIRSPCNWVGRVYQAHGFEFKDTGEPAPTKSGFFAIFALDKTALLGLVLKVRRSYEHHPNQ